MFAIQYDLFEENSEICLLKNEIEQIKKSSDAVRRGLFARHSELAKMVIKQQQEIDQLRTLLIKRV